MSKTRESAGKARHVTSERNARAICVAAERLLERGRPLSIAAVAAESRLSRVTVYGHYANLGQLLEAIVDRALRASAAAFEATAPEAGKPLEALDRVIGAGWQTLERSAAIARIALEQLPADRVRRLHSPVSALLRRLIERGQEEGVFRSDVPSEWLAECCVAIFHVAAGEVRARRIDASSVPALLTSSLHGLLLSSEDKPVKESRRGRR